MISDPPDSLKCDLWSDNTLKLQGPMLRARYSRWYNFTMTKSLPSFLQSLNTWVKSVLCYFTTSCVYLSHCMATNKPFFAVHWCNIIRMASFCRSEITSPTVIKLRISKVIRWSPGSTSAKSQYLHTWTEGKTISVLNAWSASSHMLPRHQWQWEAS